MTFAMIDPLHQIETIPNPLLICQKWYEQAQTLELTYPNAATLSTLDLDGYPDGRIVLVKEFGSESVTFFTNRESAKGRQLAVLPRAALTLYWDKLGRQIRIKGDVSLASDAQSDAYFSSRAALSQLGAWASAQSRPIQSRQALLDRVAYFEKKYHDKPIPRPPYWGGYHIVPTQVELWIEGNYRLHDRFRYQKSPEGEAGWIKTRLSP